MLQVANAQKFENVLWSVSKIRLTETEQFVFNSAEELSVSAGNSPGYFLFSHVCLVEHCSHCGEFRHLLHNVDVCFVVVIGCF